MFIYKKHSLHVIFCAKFRDNEVEERETRRLGRGEGAGLTSLIGSVTHLHARLQSVQPRNDVRVHSAFFSQLTIGELLFRISYKPCVNPTIAGILSTRYHPAKKKQQPDNGPSRIHIRHCPSPFNEPQSKSLVDACGKYVRILVILVTRPVPD